MKYLVFITVVFVQIQFSSAQSLRVPVGKKFVLSTTIDNLVEITVMDQHMQMHSEGNIKLSYEILGVQPNGYQLQVIPTHMSSTLLVNGRDQKIDTDSSSDKNNPLYAKLFELMNRPQIIEIKDHKIIRNSDLSEFNQSGLPEDPSKYFLDLNPSNLHPGFQWKDSSVNEKTKINNQYIIVQITDSLITVNVNTDFSIHNKIDQAGMSLEQNLKGYSTGNRIYRKQNFLLKEELMDMTISGSAETSEMSSPVTMKLKMKSMVE